jgi:branched-chain amino acid aminotransferase
MSGIKKVDLDWGNLDFSYRKADKRFIARFDGKKWSEGELSEDDYIRIHEGSTAIHYGQECFEGLKAYTAKDNRTLLFRPDENAKRLIRSAEAIEMQPVPVELFMKAVKNVVRANIHFVPPYGYGASFYLRPYLIGIGENLGVRPSKEYLFSIFGSPVGPYFKGGFNPVHFNVSKFDRAAPYGTGGAKVGGNYAASLKSHMYAKRNNYGDCIYLDPLTHTNIEEAGAANFFGITKDNKFVTPKSISILPSITKYSLIHIAKKMLGMEVIERDIPIDSIDEFVEAGACGTAAVITPIGSITYKGQRHSFFANGEESGPITQKLYKTLTGIQVGDIKPPEGWIFEV